MAVKNDLKRISIALDEIALKDLQEVGALIGTQNFSMIISFLLQYCGYANDYYIFLYKAKKCDDKVLMKNFASSRFDFTGHSLIRK